MTSPQKGKRRNGLWIALAAFGLFAVVMAGTSFVLLSQWSTLRTVPAEEAEGSFAARLAALGESRAYVEIAEMGAVRVNRALEGTEGVELDSLNVLAWEPEDERLIEVAFPFWFVRLKMTSSLNLGTLLTVLSQDWGNLDLKVTEEDLQRRGKGLVLDHRLADGKRILLWTE